MTVENPHAGQGSVLLDIGGDIGAVVVTMPAAMDGEEIEIRPVGATQPRESGPADHQHAHAHQHAHDHAHEHPHSHWPHVAVVARPTPSGIVHSLVFPEVVEGLYELYVRPYGAVQLIVEVVGGKVTQTAWPA